MRDHVCGMEVDPADPDTVKIEYQGKPYAFCWTGCRDKFLKDPDLYLNPSAQGRVVPQASSADLMNVIFTCPMDPEIQKLGPGHCPKCGMSLEPLDGDLGADDDESELKVMRLRFWVCAGLSAPLVLLSMGSMTSMDSMGSMGSMTTTLPGWMQAGLATPIVFWGGAPFFKLGWQSIKNRSLNMFTLIAIGTFAAYAKSAFGLVSDYLKTGTFSVETPLYFEPAAMIVTLVLLGQVIELRARKSMGQSIRALLSLSPESANRMTIEGGEEQVGLDQLKVGDLLKIRPGEKIPIDAQVVEGSSLVNESMLTGESVSVKKLVGDQVIGATINLQGALLVRVTRTVQDSELSRMIRGVRSAQRSRAPVQKLADRVSAYFVPAVIFISVLTLLVWGLILAPGFWGQALQNSIAVLVIACPCALGLATPMSIMVAMGRGARLGVLFKDAESLERLHSIDLLAIDKTGTLTEGKPDVTKFSLESGAGPLNEAEVLGIAAALESMSEHPIAKTVVEFAREKGAPQLKCEDFQSIPGQGITAKVGGKSIALGNSKMMEALGIPSGQLSHRISKSVGSLFWMTVDQKLAAEFEISDAVRPSAEQAVAALQQRGIEVVMLTGDHAKVAEPIAKALGIKEWVADLSPGQKLEWVKRFKDLGKKVAFAGDGVNDAEAIAFADVGIALGTGTDVAIQTAGVTLVKPDLKAIGRAIDMSAATLRNIQQNLFFAFIYNIAGVGLAAAGLLNPVIAALAMSLSSVSVIGNALRLRSAR